MAQECSACSRLFIAELQQKLSKERGQVTDLKNKLSFAEVDIERQVLDAQIKKRDEQLEKRREQSVLDRNSRAESESKLWEIEKELSHAKIDIRIAKCETKGIREEMKLLVDEKKSLQLKVIADREAHIQEVTALTDKINELMQQASDLQKKLIAAENDTSIFRLVSDKAKAKLAEKTEELSEVTLKMKLLETELRKEREGVVILEAKINSLVGDEKNANRRCENASDKEKALANSCDALQKKYDHIFFNYEELQKTCTELDEELQEYPKKIESLNAKIKAASKEKSDVDAEVARLRNELLLARRALNEEKSLKLKAEMRVKMLEGDVASGVEDASALETQARDYKKMAEHLTIQVSNLGDACADAESLLASEKQRNTTLLSEEEMSKYLTRMQMLKDSNHDLTCKLEQREEECKALNDNLEQSRDALQELKGTVILSTDHGSLGVNCVLQLSTDLLLIGATEGLFSLRTSAAGATPTKIGGVHDVHQIALVPAVGVALMIAGKSRELVQCELDQLTSSAEASNASIVVTPVLIPTTVKAASCHLFAVATTTDSNQHSRTTLCAATANKLILLTWSVNNVAFNVVKTLETAEPCSCIHFASHSIILGCDTFFEIDLRDFSAMEFLDPTDNSLPDACYGVRKLNSLPIAIIDVSTSHANAEYLLAFNEFGVFVDKFGQRNRDEDIKWSHMAFAFSYRKPYLFIFHFTSVEVMKLTPDSFTRDLDNSVAPVNYPGQTFIDMNSPKMLGVSTGSDTVFVSHLTDHSALQIVAMDGAQVFKDQGHC